MRRFGSLAILAAVLAVLAGCATRPINEPIERVDPNGGYRVVPTERPDNDPATLFILAFSGGGTRAAAFSYGVLEELRRTPLSVGGKPRRMLDEVDVITGISGGSFTALSYALYGERLFDEYESRFLKRDVQGTLTGRGLNPLNWPRMASTGFGRSELAAEYYDEILFEGATFGDLLRRPGPRVGVTGTDISTGARLSFTQTDFDLICSDLSKVRVSRAAATSSAVPIVLSPVTFNNYGGKCGYRYPTWVQAVSDPEHRARPAGRPLQRYHEMASFQDSVGRPYIHLVDGGVSDNLGLRSVIEGMEALEASRQFREEIGAQFRRIVVIVVNSHSAPETDWDRSEAGPGLIAIMMQASGVPIDRYSYESVELLRDIIARWNMLRELTMLRARAAGARTADALPDIKLYAIDVSFERISDPKERSYFMNQPTSFVLPAESVDRLREIAGRLLRESTEFQALVQELGGVPAGASGTR
jgi:NTE family protein